MAKDRSKQTGSFCSRALSTCCRAQRHTHRQRACSHAFMPLVGRRGSLRSYRPGESNARGLASTRGEASKRVRWLVCVCCCNFMETLWPKRLAPVAHARGSKGSQGCVHFPLLSFSGLVGLPANVGTAGSLLLLTLIDKAQAVVGVAAAANFRQMFAHPWKCKTRRHRHALLNFTSSQFPHHGFLRSSIPCVSLSGQQQRRLQAPFLCSDFWPHGLELCGVWTLCTLKKRAPFESTS